MTPVPGQTHWICPSCKVAEQFSAETLTHFHNEDATVESLITVNTPRATTRRAAQSASTNTPQFGLGLATFVIVMLAFLSYVAYSEFLSGATSTQTSSIPARETVGLTKTPTPTRLPVQTALKQLSRLYSGLDDPYLRTNSQAALVEAAAADGLYGTLRYMTYQTATQTAYPYVLSLSSASSSGLPNDAALSNAVGEPPVKNSSVGMRRVADVTDWVRYHNDEQVMTVRDLRIAEDDPQLTVTFAPDGRRYAVDTYSQSLGRRQLVLFDPDAPQQKRFVPTGYSPRHVTWSPSGERLLFTGTSDVGSGLFAVEFDKLGVKRIVETTSNAIGIWLTEQTVIYSAETDQGSALFFRNVDGSPSTPFTTGRGNVVEPALSPDGHFLAFAADWAQTYDLYAINLSSGDLFRLTFTQHLDERMPVWAP